MKPLAPQAKSPAFGRLGLLCVALCWMAFPGWGQVSTDEEALPTRILFVFDASNSMNAFWGGDRKIQTATRLLSETLKGLHQSDELELGLRVYGHGTKHVPGKQDCDDTELVVPFSSFNNLIIKQALSRIRAQGTTPIARSLELAAQDFPEAPGRNVIVLITD
ncbi:MAG: vWA domain-containing protein, partial [Flavobacteriales bacterium]